MLKKLILGRYSLAKTFWLFGLVGAIVLSIVAYSSISFLFVVDRDLIGFLLICFLLSIIFEFLLSLSVFSGITFLLREDMTFWRVIAWIIYLIIILSWLVNFRFWFFILSLFTMRFR